MGTPEGAPYVGSVAVVGRLSYVVGRRFGGAKS